MNRAISQRVWALLFTGTLAAACGAGDPPAAADDDAALDDTAYLTQLGLIRGHLRVGIELYREGRHDHAKRHMKHPEDELYATLAGEFERRDAAGFADELATLAARVEQDADAAAVESAYAALLERIAAAEAKVAAPQDPALHGRVAARLLDTAAEEYGIGVVDGQISEVHEYQDAYGFTQVAIAHAALADAGGLESEIEALAPLWPELVPEAALAVATRPARRRVSECARRP